MRLNISNAAFLSLVAVLTWSLSSCQKVIDLTLPESSAKVVVQGNLTDVPGSQPVVKLTRTVNYDQSNAFPAVAGAFVLLEDMNTGQKDTLEEGAAGIYSSAGLIAQQGHTYKLMVMTDGNMYTATSTVPVKVPLDSIYVENFTGFGRTVKSVYPVYTDPSGFPNYYSFELFVNQVDLELVNVRNDRYSDGKKASRPIFPENEDDIEKGDVLTVRMLNTDEGYYKYFSTLNRADGNAGAPANPVTNIQGGAMGYFGAYTVQERTLIVP